MDPDQASRPSLTQRQSSQHTFGAARGGLRVRNISSKNLSKLGKVTVAHAGTKVAMPRNTSKTNLRKNQSETSLQHDKRNRASASPSKSEQSSSVARRSSAVAAHSLALTSSQRHGSGSGSFIPEVNPITSYDPSRGAPVHNQAIKQRGKKRSSKDFSASKKRGSEHPFEFDGDDEFDDEAWEDERQDVSTTNQPEMEIPEATYNYYQQDENVADAGQKAAIPTSYRREFDYNSSTGQDNIDSESYHQEPKHTSPAERQKATITFESEGSRPDERGNQHQFDNEDDDDDDDDETEEAQEDGKDATPAERRGASKESDNYRDNTGATAVDSAGQKNRRGSSGLEHEEGAVIDSTARKGNEPIKAPSRITFQTQKRKSGIGAESSGSEDTNSETRNIKPANSRNPATADARSKGKIKMDATPKDPSQHSEDDQSDTESSPDTVVLAPTARKAPPPSALKSPRLDLTEPSAESPSPMLTMKATKKVQIEEPHDEIEVTTPPMFGESAFPSPSQSGASATTVTPKKPPAPRQYEFLSKAQRDRASLMQEAHPYPPSAWRDQFLSRAIPHVNNVHEDYTKKFARRLDRRVDGRLGTVMETRDPLLEGLRRVQARGHLAGPDQTAYTPAEPPRPSGIQGWFSRLGGSKKEEQKPLSREEFEAERLERWSAMLGRYQWKLAQDRDKRQDNTPFYIDVDS